MRLPLLVLAALVCCEITITLANPQQGQGGRPRDQGQPGQANNANGKKGKAGFMDVWSPPFGDLTLDPNTWTPEFKDRMVKVGVAGTAAILNHASFTNAMLLALFVFGVVNLTWLITATAVMSFLGWQKKQMLLMAGGALVTYYLLFQVAASPEE